MQRHLYPLISLLLSLPAALWCRWQEGIALRRGRPLTTNELADANAAGVKNPSRIRILEVPSIPNPFRGAFKALEHRSSLCISNACGLTLRYGIFITPGHHPQRDLLVHEFVHTAQYERIGNLRKFLSQYLLECLSSGYFEAPLEKEARLKAATICR